MWSCVMSYDKVKTFYLHYHIVYGEVTWQIKNTLYFHLQKTNGHKGKILTYREKLPSLNPQKSDHMINVRLFDKLKNLYLHFHKVYSY